MTKKTMIHIAVLFSLVSCDLKIKKDYINLVPYLEVEKTKDVVFKNINVDEYIYKIESNLSFICFFYSSSCIYCDKLIKNIINPYIKKTNNLVYGIDVYQDENYQKLIKIEKYQPEDNDYFLIRKDDISIIRPLTQIIDKGQIIDYEKGYSIVVLDMIEAYIK